MESNQVHVFAAAVSCDLQQIIHTVKSRFTGQIERDVGDGYLRDRVHDDVALFHPVPATNLHVGARPDANAASDSSIPNSIAEVLTEHHMQDHPNGHRPSQALAPPCYGGHRPPPLNSSEIILLTREIRRTVKQRQVPTQPLVGGRVASS
jgi:hypothetical protein